MSERLIYEYGIATLIIQLIIVFILLYGTYASSKTRERKRLLYTAFLMYGLFIFCHVPEYIIKAGLGNLPLLEITALFGHMFKTFFFLIYGYGLIGAIVTDKALKQINKINATIGLVFISIFTLGVIVIEGKELAFRGTMIEVVYPVMTMVIQVLIINIILYSWLNIPSKRLLLTGIAFALFLLADIAHTYNIIWEFSTLEFFVRHLFRTLALGLLAYTTITTKRTP
jgi:hypothetical protein